MNDAQKKFYFILLYFVSTILYIDICWRSEGSRNEIKMSEPEKK